MTDAAIAELQEAIQLLNAFPEAHYGLGLALADKGRLTLIEAVEEVQASILQSLTLRDFAADRRRSLGGPQCRMPEAAAAAS